MRAALLSLTFLALGKGASLFDHQAEIISKKGIGATEVKEELVVDVVEEDVAAPVVVQEEEVPFEYLVFDGGLKEETPLEWMTTQQKASEFSALGEVDFVREEEEDGIASIEFERIDHQLLLANYLESVRNLKEEAPVEVGVAAVVEDVVSEKVAKNEAVAAAREEPKPLVFDYSEKESKKGEYNPFSSEAFREKRVDTAVSTPSPEEILKKMDEREREEAGNSAIDITIQEFSFSRGPGKAQRGFEIRPDYSERERWGDRGSGRLSIQKKLNSPIGVIGSLLYKQGAVETRVNLSFEHGVAREFSIPVFSQEEFTSFLDKRNLSGGGGFLFIELDDSTESVGLDTRYEELFYLNSKLQVVEASDDYHYILFAGIEPGPTTMEYIRNGYENLKKVILIEEGVIYYELNEYLKVKEDIVNIEQTNVFSTEKSAINITGEEIVQFNSFEQVSQIGPSRYDFSIGSIPTGTRKYVEFNHLSAPIYLGRWEAKSVSIPSEDYISFFLKTMEIEDLTGLCLVQVNFKDRVKKLNVEGKDGVNYIPLDFIYMDGEGLFSEELSPLAVQGFILSDQVGVLSMEVQYESGMRDYLNSYCSSSTYLIEQL